MLLDPYKPQFYKLIIFKHFMSVIKFSLKFKEFKICSFKCAWLLLGYINKQYFAGELRL